MKPKGNGFDLFITEDIVIKPKENCVIRHKVAGMMMLNGRPVAYNLYPRGSIGRRGLILLNSVGLVDDDYTGDVSAHVFNYTDGEVHLSKGQRIAQIAAATLQRFEVEFVDSFPETTRGSGAYGSTGL